MKKLLIATAFAVGLVPLSACCFNPLACAECLVGLALLVAGLPFYLGFTRQRA